MNTKILQKHLCFKKSANLHADFSNIKHSTNLFFGFCFKSLDVLGIIEHVLKLKMTLQAPHFPDREAQVRLTSQGHGLGSSRPRTRNQHHNSSSRASFWGRCLLPRKSLKCENPVWCSLPWLNNLLLLLLEIIMIIWRTIIATKTNPSQALGSRHHFKGFP